MRVLIFGDSITQGFWDSEGGWVARLRKQYDILQVKDFDSDQPTIFNLGISADTIKNVLTRFKPETEARKRHGDLAFIFSIGTNNAAEGDGLTFDPEQYKNDLKELISMAREFSQKILLVGLPPCDEKLTVPVSWAAVSYTNEHIQAIENAIKDVAQTDKLQFVPIFDEFKKRSDAGEVLLADGLHPSDKGHELIYSIVKPELEKLLA